MEAGRDLGGAAPGNRLGEGVGLVVAGAVWLWKQVGTLGKGRNSGGWGLGRGVALGWRKAGWGVTEMKKQESSD